MIEQHHKLKLIYPHIPKYPCKLMIALNAAIIYLKRNKYFTSILTYNTTVCGVNMRTFINFCNEIEDEMHFLFSCNQYVNERISFLSSIKYNVQSSQAELFKYLCCNYARRFSKYVNSIWMCRKENLFQ